MPHPASYRHDPRRHDRQATSVASKLFSAQLMSCLAAARRMAAFWAGALLLLGVFALTANAQADRPLTDAARFEPPRPYVATEAAHIRAEPTLESSIIGRMTPGQTMKVTGRRGDFLETPLIGGGVGFVHRLYAQPLGPGALLREPTAAAGPRWQAMAFSSVTGSLGIAYNHIAADNARRAALNACGRDDCSVRTASEGCVAMAISRVGAQHVGFGAGANADQAGDAARIACRRSAPDGLFCEVWRITCPN